ncbi:MAG: hypothetical protein ACI8PT_002394 [Gammaproteobacteria bacterium]
MDLNCPSCGGAVPSRLKYAKLLVCPHCQVSLFLEDEAVKNAGERSVLTTVPSIFELGRRYQYRNWTLETYGRVRFDYGHGFWDEWWVVLDSGQGRWVSIDEGDIAVESPIEFNQAPPDFDSLVVGHGLSIADHTGTVTEKNEAVCLGLEGELPEVIAPGDRHQYAHLSAPGGVLLTLEFYPDRFALTKGLWIDPFDIQTL